MSGSDIASFDTRDVDGEVALAQLGAAVVLAWPDLDSDLQRDLLTTAGNIAGIRTDPQIREIIERLVLMNDHSRHK